MVAIGPVHGGRIRTLASSRDDLNAHDDDEMRSAVGEKGSYVGGERSMIGPT